MYPTRFPQPGQTDFMQTLHLENSRLQLAIEPEAGASISAFALRHGGEWIPVLRPTPPEAIR
ncbi:MAG TPA: hypothetical protein DCG06_12595, partial [Deltaproteobacteria bacterium]|nr:hypothetical protein [Deltaproteobacteria bacterium]